MDNAGSWESLEPPLSEKTVAALHNQGFVRMTPVQACSIPHFLTHKDVAVQASTGSGKTLAFLIPVFELLERREDPLRKTEVGAMIVTPTRELAQQIAEVGEKLLQSAAYDNQYNLLRVIGGTSSIQNELKILKEKGAAIIVGTPGRLNYFLKNAPGLVLKELEVLILDEADRLLDMGFQAELNTILRLLPKQRRTGLFSATQTTHTDELVRAGLRNPISIEVKAEKRKSDNNSIASIPDSLDNYYVRCESVEKLSYLIKFLEDRKSQKFIIFFLTCNCVDYFYKLLLRVTSLRGLSILSFHGRAPNKRRIEVFKKFSNAKDHAALLTTDVAARGLDVPDVDWILQFDAPQNPDAFIHRIGRTARMGRKGKAMLFLRTVELNFLEYLGVKNVPIKEWEKCKFKFRTEEIKKWIIKDRELLDYSIRAFVSYLRGYQEHLLKYIFRFDKLDLGKLATSFCLLKLPKSPELNDKELDFKPTDVNMDNIPYRDKNREKHRLRKLAERRKAEELKQSKETQQEEEEEEDDDDEEEDKPRLPRKSKEEQDEEDMEELLSDYKLVQKLKRSKRSKRKRKTYKGRLSRQQVEAMEAQLAGEDAPV